MKRLGDVSIIPCKVNGIDLELIFDTGASDVSISLTEADLMLKNGKLTNNDIIGTSNYLNANGDINEGIIINIKEIEIAGLKMTNIKALVVKNLDAPLLLGQSAISKLGKIQLDLNNNTLTILNGRGTYDYSNYSLTDKIEKYYKEFSIVKIEKKDNNDGMFFSYTIPNKWKVQKVTNPEIFRHYFSDEYPLGLMYELKIELQTLPSLYNNYDSCRNLVDYTNDLIKNVDPSFKVISVSNTKVSFCKTIKNITFTKDLDINKISCQYYIFVGNKLINLMYAAYSPDSNKIISITSEFEEFCNLQVSNVVVYNALEKAANCTIQSNAIENKKDISIILNNSCNWFKSEGKSEELYLVNNSTSSTLSIGISNRNYDLIDFNTIKSDDLEAFKNTIIKNIDSSREVINSGIVTINKKKYIYFSTKSKNENNYILTENYYYVFNNRLITIFSFSKDEDETNLKLRFQKTQKDLKDLLMGIEIVGKKPQIASDYFNKGVANAQANNFKEAILNFNKVIELNPQFPEAYYNRGIAKFRLQDNIGAIQDFNKAISINPSFMRSYYNRGAAKFQLQDYQGALADFDKAIEIQSDFADAYLNRGIVKIVMGTKESGCTDLNKASLLGSTKADIAIKSYCK